MKSFFITSSGTGIGKTFVTAALCYQLRQKGQQVHAIKPVISGFDVMQVAQSDTGILLQSMGLEITEENIQRISPIRFTAPLSPDMAARMENKSLDFSTLMKFCTNAQRDGINLVEGVGGIMAPLDATHTVLDLIKALDMPVLLVSGSYLGALSHTLTALAVLDCAKVSVHAVVVSESEGSAVPLDETVYSLRQFAGKTLVHAVKRCATLPAWKHAPDITEILE